MRVMTKWLFRFVWIPVLAAAVWFLVANRTPVAISLDPFRPDNPALSSPALPLWFWLMAMLFLGVAIGALGGWLSGSESRAQARDNRKAVKALQKEVAVLTARSGAASNDPPSLVAIPADDPLPDEAAANKEGGA